MTPRCVLVVDDEPQIVTRLTSLAAWATSSKSRATARKRFQGLTTSPPTSFLLDLMLPVKDGF